MTTESEHYKQAINTLWPEVEAHFAQHIGTLIRLIPLMGEKYKQKIAGLAKDYVNEGKHITQDNPFNVTITEGGWAGNGRIIRDAIHHYYLVKAFPGLLEPDAVFDGLHYLYGTHPDSDISLVSNVGTVSKSVAYGMNRADFSFISGGVVPGILIIKPDLPENNEEWPFFWGQNEYVINIAASYIMLVHAVDDLLSSSAK